MACVLCWVAALLLISTPGNAIRQKSADKPITGSICHGSKGSFQTKPLKPDWFENPKSPTTKGKYARALVLPPNKKCKPKAKRTDNCITIPMIMGDKGVDSLLKIAKDHNKASLQLDENKQYAIAKLKKGQYQFGKSKEEKRALCIFYHWNTARDISGENVPPHDMWAAKEWRGSPAIKASSYRVFFPKGPKGDKFWDKGHSGYWDPSAIYHEAGHALWSTMRDWKVLWGMDSLSDALEEGFCDAFSCAVLMESGQMAQGSDCVIGAYYDRSTGGVRSNSYSATGAIPNGHKFDHIVKNKCNNKATSDECEKHRVGEVFASALFRATASGVKWNIILSGIKELLRLTTVQEKINDKLLSPTTEQTLVQTTRDCIMQQIKDDKTYRIASAAFADHGMGIDMDQSHDNNIGKAGYGRVTTVAAGATHYKCQLGLRKPSGVSQSEWDKFKPKVGIKI